MFIESYPRLCLRFLCVQIDQVPHILFLVINLHSQNVTKTYQAVIWLIVIDVHAPLDPVWELDKEQVGMCK